MSDLLKSIRETGRRYEEGLNLKGRTLVKCAVCDGKGYSEPSRTDHDAHGSYWVSQVDCRACGGQRRVEVACAPELEVRAIRNEIARLQARMKELGS